MQQLVQHRLGLLWKSLGWTLEPGPERAGYYSVIDLGIWATRLYGADFFTWLKKNYDSLAVSYTHLDVYKRQGLHFVLVAFLIQRLGWFELVCQRCAPSGQRRLFSADSS